MRFRSQRHTHYAGENMNPLIRTAILGDEHISRIRSEYLSKNPQAGKGNDPIIYDEQRLIEWKRQQK